MTAPAPRVIDNHLVLQHDPGPLRLLFPNLVKEARIKGETYCALPHSLDIVRVLNNVGVKAPSPIRIAYDWPGRYRPRWYQIDTAEFLTLNSRAFVLSQQRTGKTLAALWAADYLRRAGKIGSTLIVAPLSTLWDVWQTNIFESFPLRTFAVLHGSREKRHDLLAKKHDFYIINHHGVGLIETALKDRPDIDLVIVDEVATFRNARASTLFKPLNRIINGQGVSRSAWGLTGTPTPNEPTDAFGQAKLINPTNYKGHFTSFKHETMLQINQFKWVPKRGHEESVARILKPSIRFERSVCTDMQPCFIERRAELSQEQGKAYKQLIQYAASEVRGATVTAVNAAVLVSKIVQTSCLSSDVEVLCSRGWVPIVQVARGDLVWDGISWVKTDGCIYRGEKEVIKCGSVKMTRDHRVLTTVGWVQAGEMYGETTERFAWADVRLPYSYIPGRNIEERGSDMVVPVPMWGGSSARWKSAAGQQKNSLEELRMPLGSYQGEAPAKLFRDIQAMDSDTIKMLKHKLTCIPILRRTRDFCVRAVGLLRELFRRHGAIVQAWYDFGQNRQQRPVLSGKLPMGYAESSDEQHTMESQNQHTERQDDHIRGKRSVWCAAGDTTKQAEPRVAGRGGAVPRVTAGSAVRQDVGHAERQDDSTSSRERVRDSSEYSSSKVSQRGAAHSSVDNQTATREKVSVYDLVNCGPRNRFVVRGDDNVPRIVHNCGVVIDADGNFVKIDFGPRLKVLEELVEENNEKVLVFVPFTGALDAVASELRKRWSVEIVDGRVSAGKRTDIFQRFRSAKDPHVLVCHPQVMAHGLDLTAASLSIWYAPTWKAEVYQQANARMDGSKQKVKMDIACIYATAEEKRIYSVLRDKGRLQDVVLSLANVEV